jgi:hypothetical protein
MRPAFPGLWCALLVLSTAALAQPQEGRVEQPLQSFFFSDPAYLQPPQQLQVGVGAVWNGDTEESNTTVPFQLQFGVSELFEFSGDVRLAFPRPLTGNLRTVDRAEATVSMRLIDDGARGVVVSTGLGFVGSRDPLDSSFDTGGVPRLSALVKYELLVTNVSLSVDLVSRNDDLAAVPRGALAVALDFGQLQPVFEAAYENDEAPTGIFALGLRFLPFDSLEVGAAVPLEVSEDEVHVGVAGNLVWSVGG